MPDASRPGLRSLARDVAVSGRGHDLALYAAGWTAFAAVGVVPLLLLVVRLAALPVGADRLVEDAAALVGRVPVDLGGRDAAQWLLDTGARLSAFDALLCLVPASLYGEGLVRSLDRLSVDGERGHRTLRGRAGAAGLLAVAPVLLLAGVAAANGLTDLLGEGVGAAVLGVYLTFLVTWLALSALLVLTYRGLAPQRPGTRAVLWGGFGTASVVAGFALGWVLFLRLGVPVERAYAGAELPGALAAAVLWLLVLHALVLVGYVVTLRLDARDGHPRGPVVRASTVRAAAPARASGTPDRA